MVVRGGLAIAETERVGESTTERRVHEGIK
jgi:hypothetical protein